MYDTNVRSVTRRKCKRINMPPAGNNALNRFQKLNISTTQIAQLGSSTLALQNAKQGQKTLNKDWIRK